VHGVYSIGNISFSGEYAEIVRDKNTKYTTNSQGTVDTSYGEETSFLPIGDDPYGMTAKAELITNRFNLLALYRHYDVDFDNPYNRGFSEYSRYKGSILEKDYRLTNPDYVSIAEENPRPQAEEGFYFEMWTRPFRTTTTAIQFDSFKRLTDMADYRRIVLKVNYRPNSRINFRLWQKWQGRFGDNNLTFMDYTVNETRIICQTRLNDWSTVDFAVVHSIYESSARPSFSGMANSSEYNDNYGQACDPSNALMIGADINATERLSINGQAIIYKGWLWNFENNDFAILESEKTDAMRLWFAVTDRMAKNLSVTLKLSVDTPLTSTNFDSRDLYDDDGVLEGGVIRNTNTAWLLQFDYFF